MDRSRQAHLVESTLPPLVIAVVLRPELRAAVTTAVDHVLEQLSGWNKAKGRQLAAITEWPCMGWIRYKNADLRVSVKSEPRFNPKVGVDRRTGAGTNARDCKPFC
jgi:hypothetical protein